MLEAIYYVRKSIIAKLNGNVLLNNIAVPVYNRIPTDATYPLIRVYSVLTDETDQNQQSFNTETITRIECITKFYSDDGGQLDCNLMASQCLEQVRTRSANYIDLLPNGFNVYTSVNEGVTYLEDDLSDFTYFRAIIEISNKIEQVVPVIVSYTDPLQSELQLEYRNQYTDRIIADGGQYESIECIETDVLYK